ncbi:MAG: hypothetical protein ABIU96_03620 [Rhodanobacter sp.]
MDEKQAGAVSGAILEPGLKDQDELREKRKKEAARLTAQRRSAAFALAGMGIGGAVGHFAFGHFSQGFVIGGGSAYLLARIVQWRTV